MAARRVEIKVVLDLAKGSKEAHEVTIARIAKLIGENAVEVIEEHGYKVRKAEVTHLLHYVRHEVTRVLKRPVIRKLKSVV